MSSNLSTWLTLLSVPGLGPVTISLLFKHFKTPERILNASCASLLAVQHIGPEIARAIQQAQNPTWACEQIQRASEADVKILTLQDPAFPSLLKQIYAPPPILFAKGNLDILQVPALAIVGSRSFTHYGRNTARCFAHDLAVRGTTVVSGLAMGIDTHAHRGALEARGKTIAVLGSSLDHPYPSENLDLFHQICTDGLVLSEFPMDTTARPHHFPRRNRIISGISQGILVVEAGKQSGALITAEQALDQNRDVFAIPGPINSGKSWGTNHLIQQGAILVQTVDDILSTIQPAYGLPALPPNTDSDSLDLSPEEKTVLKALSVNEPSHIDHLAFITGYSPPEVLTHLLFLELNHLIEQLPGKQFQRLTA
ncbi:MAG: DNA-processing protein DprA [bacterium]|nr:DNA-processing protein DprA [bacterium]